jgi:hypothetical protein
VFVAVAAVVVVAAVAVSNIVPLRAGIVVVLGRRLLLLHKLWTGLLPLNDEFAVMLVRLAKVVGRRLKAGKGRSVVA